jgi:hypothetical protein
MLVDISLLSTPAIGYKFICIGALAILILSAVFTLEVAAGDTPASFLADAPEIVSGTDPAKFIALIVSPPLPTISIKLSSISMPGKKSNTFITPEAIEPNISNIVAKAP